MSMERPKYDRLRRVEALDRLLVRFSSQPFSKEDYRPVRHSARVKRIWTRLILVLWELPTSLQTGLCSALAQRTLPAFEQRHPTLTSMRNFLDPDWIREVMGRSGASGKERWEQLGYELNALNQALDEQSPMGGDELLYGAAGELWDALAPDAAPGMITYHCIHSTILAITAEQHEAWEFLDPEAAEYVRDIHARIRREGHAILPKVPTKYRIPEADPAAQATWFAGWEAALTWLRSAHLEDYHEVKDRSALAKAVRRSRIGRKDGKTD